MQVILLQRVEKLGMMGQVVEVKPGFARNYLLPKKIALRATKANLSVFEQQKTELEAQNLKAKQDAEFVSEKIAGVALKIVRKAGETNQLYGAVSARDIADELLAATTVSVNRTQISIANPIKSLGIYDISVTLHPEVKVLVRISIAQSAEEAQQLLDAEAKKTEAKKTEATGAFA